MGKVAWAIEMLRRYRSGRGMDDMWARSNPRLRVRIASEPGEAPVCGFAVERLVPGDWPVITDRDDPITGAPDA